MQLWASVALCDEQDEEEEEEEGEGATEMKREGKIAFLREDAASRRCPGLVRI